MATKDDFKRLNVQKSACPVCPPFRGENRGRMGTKERARRRARHVLKLRLDLVRGD